MHPSTFRAMPALLWSFAQFALLFLLLSGAPPATAVPAPAAGDALVGTWQGELSINASTHLTIQFIVNRSDAGKLSAVLNAPEQANLQNIAVSSVVTTDDRVVFVVDEVNGRYEGVLKNGRLTGQWKQNGAAFDGQGLHVHQCLRVRQQ